MTDIEYVFVKNNGIGHINEKQIPNCCIFISLGIIWKHVNKDDFTLHEEVFKSCLNREVSPEEMVYSILKIKSPEVIATLGETQIDTLLEDFVKYTKLKLSVFLSENGMKWDLFDGNIVPDGIIIQHSNHYECAIQKKYMN